MGVTVKSSQSERIAVVEQRLTDVEARWDERLAEIKVSIADMLRAVEGLKSRFWAIVLSLLAWALAQVWSANQGRLERLEAARPSALQEVADVSAH